MLKYSETPGVFRLEGKKLGRPYHRLPDVFNRKFDVIDLRISNWSLRKHRADISLSGISFQMDVANKTAELLSSPIGNVGFDIDRPLLLTFLDKFYGMENTHDQSSATSVLTKTEQRLKSRLALELITLLFDDDSLNLPLPVKYNSTGVQTTWAWQATFNFSEAQGRTFSLLLDDAHTDYILMLLRKQDKHLAREAASATSAPVGNNFAHAINTLGLRLKVKVTELSMNVAMLTTLQPGDILPVSLPDRFPVFIGPSQLFTGAIIEEHDRLRLSDIKEIIPEKLYEQ